MLILGNDVHYSKDIYIEFETNECIRDKDTAESMLTECSVSPVIMGGAAYFVGSRMEI